MHSLLFRSICQGTLLFLLTVFRQQIRRPIEVPARGVTQNRLAYVGYFTALTPGSECHNSFLCVEMLIAFLLQLFACDEKSVLPPFLRRFQRQMVVCFAHVFVKYQHELLGGQLLSVLFVHECSLPMTLVM